MFEQIYNNIVKNLKSYKNKNIKVEDVKTHKNTKIKDLISFSGNDKNEVNKIRTSKYHEFEDAIIKLCSDGKLIASGKIPKGHRLNSIYKVKDNINNKEKDNKTIIEISRLNLKNLHYYLANQDEYKRHKKYLKKLSDYYIQPSNPRLTSNELSFKLFNDEKFFENPKTNKNLGLQIIKNVRMEYEDFNCYRTQEPIFVYQKACFFQKGIRKILIIENKDTYFTLKNKKCCEVFDMFIYGEGKKILYSFELAEEYLININDSIEYFGDIDSEGFRIYKRFREKFSIYNIKICRPLYHKILDNFGIDTLPKMRNFLEYKDSEINFVQAEDTENINDGNKGKYCKIEPSILGSAIEVVNSEFQNNYANKIIAILNCKKYIPQEAIALIDTNQELVNIE